MLPLVIICGPPASGKSMVAEALSQRLSLPVISKDLVKQAMMDHLGGAPAVAAATFSVQFAIARELLDSGVGLILEGAFFPEQAEIAELAQLARAVVVNANCEYGMPEIHAPTLEVDVTKGFNPPIEEIISWVRQRLEAVTAVRMEPEAVDLPSAWRQHAPAWIEWARKPDHDSYWRFGRAAFFELLPPPGRLTLDLGCGEGRVSRDLAARGHRVVSIDAAQAMVRAAFGINPSIPAVVADAAVLPLTDSCSDLVIAYMSLHDMTDMQAAVKEAARALLPGGRLCLAVVHPLNSAGQFTSFEADADFVIRGSYLESHPYVDRVERDGLVMTFASLHHPLGEYFMALENAGLLVEAVREIPADEDSARDAPRRQRWRRLPLFLAVRAIKPGRA